MKTNLKGETPCLFRILDPRSLVQRTLDEAGLRREFAETGALVLPGFFPEETLRAVRAELDFHYAPLHAAALDHARSRQQERKEQADKACDVIPWHPLGEGNEQMQRLHDDPRLVEITRIVLGDGFTANFGLVMYSVGGGRGQAWHQDCLPEKPEAFNLNRLIYPEDVSWEDGALVYVPGSHRRGQIPPGGHQEPMEGEITLTPSAGTLVLLNGQVYHRVTPNLNAKPRTSVNFRAFPPGAPTDLTCVAAYRNGTVNFCDQPKTHDGRPAAMA